MAQAKDKVVDVLKFKIEEDGSFKRPETSFRNFVEKGGKFEPEIAVTVVSPRMGSLGWPFANVDDYPGTDVDSLNNAEHVKDIYFKVDPDFQGSFVSIVLFSVPILWDKKTQTIVNNESSEIIRIFNTAFDEFIAEEKAALDFYPANLRPEIDKVNELVYENINNGVYRAGVATSQAAYEKAVTEVFEALDQVEKILEGQEYLVQNILTEADIRLFVTIIRFDVVYFGHFKCNLRTIRDGYPAVHSLDCKTTSKLNSIAKQQ
ncbi:hypothetical protein H0H81_011698 [Sphagnurus paluster]|uniref:Glutathione S-transferase n=1 Tax=Sphagnurus paluster TaxID=117069 RepID=A0A9P7GH96_9AGAR|nr:hypothetical protein H0H81_011698 [Sphagnurus paluster]